MGWRPPEFQWVKLNIDGAVKGNSKEASAGSLIRDHYRKWIGGFVMNIKIGTVTSAEL